MLDDVRHRGPSTNPTLKSPIPGLDGLKEFVAEELKVAKEGERPLPAETRRKFRV